MNTWGDLNYSGPGSIWQNIARPDGTKPTPKGATPTPTTNTNTQKYPDIYEAIQNDTRQGALRDVFNYVWHYPRTVGRPQGEGAYEGRSPAEWGDDFDYQYIAPYENDSTSQDFYRQNTMQIKPGSYLDQLSQRFGGAFTLNRADTPDGGQGWMLNGDWSKLPQTRFGGVGGTTPLTQHNARAMINPNLAYFDENYGWITPSSNINQDYGKTWLQRNTGPLLLAALTAGAGSAFGAAGLIPQGGLLNGVLNPSTAMNILRTVGGAIGGNYGGAGSFLLNLALQQAGVGGLPAFALRTGGNLALNQLLQRYRQGGGG